MATLFEQYAGLIRSTNFQSIKQADQIPGDFSLGTSGLLTCCYTPFDLVNKNARLVLVGITPGLTQWINAMSEAQTQLRRGTSIGAAQLAAKHHGAFSGAMRQNLVDMLDSVGVQHWLDIASCQQLFDAQSNLLHSTSILGHATFKSGDNYNGSPSMIKTPFLQEQLVKNFAAEIAPLKAALFIPLGPKVSEGMNWLARQGFIQEKQIVHGLPHPSAANMERIAYFLGRKQKHLLSIKTNGDQLDAARTAILEQLAAA